MFLASRHCDWCYNKNLLGTYTKNIPRHHTVRHLDKNKQSSHPVSPVKYQSFHKILQYDTYTHHTIRPHHHSVSIKSYFGALTELQVAVFCCLLKAIHNFSWTLIIAGIIQYNVYVCAHTHTVTHTRTHTHVLVHTHRGKKKKTIMFWRSSVKMCEWTFPHDDKTFHNNSFIVWLKKCNFSTSYYASSTIVRS